jgi:hypothetical protein
MAEGHLHSAPIILTISLAVCHAPSAIGYRLFGI